MGMTRRRLKSVTAAIVLAVGLGVAGCGSTSKAATKATATTNGPTATTQGRGTPTAPAAGGSNLTGMGATVAQMATAHGADRGQGVAVCSASNACFGPGITNADSGQTYQFTNVLTGGGLITGYDQSFVPNTVLNCC